MAFITIHVISFFNLQSLLETHDSVASKNYETPPPSPCSFMDAALNNQPVPPDAVRMVGIRKVSGEHLVSLLSKRFGSYLFLSFSSSEKARGGNLMIRVDLKVATAERRESCTVRLAVHALFEHFWL